MKKKIIELQKQFDKYRMETGILYFLVMLLTISFIMNTVIYQKSLVYIFATVSFILLATIQIQMIRIVSMSWK